jgi:hypothetical protein
MDVNTTIKTFIYAKHKQQVFVFLICLYMTKTSIANSIPNGKMKIMKTVKPMKLMRGGAGDAAAYTTRGAKQLLYRDNVASSISNEHSIITYLLLFILFILFGMVGYMFYIYVVKESTIKTELGITHGQHTSGQSSPVFISTTSNLDKINDPYVPPLKWNSWLPLSWLSSDPYPHYDIHHNATLPTISSHGYLGSGGGGGIVGHHAHHVLNMKTRGQDGPFQQVGYIKDEDTILPLMGRNVDNARDKSQYFTMTNQGNVNTKLPVKVNGRNCSGEYGCDSVYDGDNIYVEGIEKQFTAKIYENVPLSYVL